MLDTIDKSEVLEKLRNGYSLDYAPVTGGVVLIKYGAPALYPDISIFLELRKERSIDLYSTMNQGHTVFHGRVDRYSIPNGD